MAKVHNDVVLSQWDVSVASCQNRLEHLRRLVRKGALEEAIDTSFFLGDRDGLHSACLEDTPFIGEATLSALAARPSDGGPSKLTYFIQLHLEEGENATRTSADKSNWLPVLYAGAENHPLAHNTRVNVVGFVLDGAFVLAESPVRCRLGSGDGGEAPPPFVVCDGGASMRGFRAADTEEALGELAASLHATTTTTAAAAAAAAAGESSTTTGEDEGEEEVQGEEEEEEEEVLSSAGAEAFRRRRQRRLEDISTSYARGAKSILAIPIFPADSASGASSSAPFGYCYGRVSSDFGCTPAGVNGYLAELLRITADFYSSASWGALSFTSTITPMLRADYRGASCGSHDLLDTMSGRRETAFDDLAFAAASRAGFDASAFDFSLVFIPRCRDIGFSGYAWIGRPGAALNLFATDFDSSVSHEIGHNLGGRHAATMARGSRGRAAWEENGLRDYGNPHSVMGGCRVDDCHCDPLVEGKMVFDWVDNALVPTLDPSTCTPSCGPFDLYQTDLGSKPADALVGLQLSTSIRNRFFFVEHRAESTSGPAALVSWSDVRGNSGGTGTYGRSVLADCTPGTSSFTDAGCKPGGRIALDAGTAAAPRPITVVVGGVSGRKLAVYVSTNLQFEVPADTTTTRPAPAATVTKAERVAARKAARIAARKAAREAARQNGE